MKKLKFYTIFLLAITLSNTYAKTSCEYYDKTNNLLGKLTWTKQDNKIIFTDSNYIPSNYNNVNDSTIISNTNSQHFFSDIIAIKNEFSISEKNDGERSIQFSDQSAAQKYYATHIIEMGEENLRLFAFNLINDKEQRTYVLKKPYQNPWAVQNDVIQGFIQLTIQDKPKTNTSPWPKPIVQKFNLKNCKL